MARFFHWDNSRHRQIPSVWFLACFWLCGLLVGAALFRMAEIPDTDLLREAVTRPVSMTGSLVVSGFPFLLSAIAVSFSSPRLLFLVAFGKGICVCFVSLCVSSVFGAAGWLMRYLVMFSDFWILPWLVWFWIVSLQSGRNLRIRSFAVCCGAALVGALLDTRFISPLLGRL